MRDRGDFWNYVVAALLVAAGIVLFAGERYGFWDVLPDRRDALYDRG